MVESRQGFVAHSERLQLPLTEGGDFRREETRYDRSEGAYGRYLLLALAVEKGRGEHAGRLASSLGPTSEVVDKSALAALDWAQQAISFGRT
jgi:hypothetical protein